MPLSWNEIRQNAIAFSREWAQATRERGDAQSFWNEFFRCFGVSRRMVASFEAPVATIRGTYEFIDLLWPGTLIAESKSRGGDLDRAHSQAMGYIRGLIHEDRRDEVPRYIVVSDFARIALHDLETDRSIDFPLAQLHENINAFAFIAGYRTEVLDPEDDANIQAAELLADLHDTLEAGGYPDHDIERFMVRLLFCLFAEDTGLFGQPDAFRLYLENTTRPDGSDLGLHLGRFFEVLNTPNDRRQNNLDEQLRGLPYVNGELFAQRLPAADFNRDMRNQLLGCCRFRWARISPAVFGSLFQSIMEDKERRQIGAHYTSERDIMKLIRSLFLDDLKAELERAKNEGRAALNRFHRRIGELRFLDPACGCGNFLVIAFRELRLLELETLKELHRAELRDGQRVLEVRNELRVTVDQMHGIEIEEWPVRIAEVALWLMDHQMNLEVSSVFGEYVARLPLENAPTIRHANALRIDWNEVLPAGECSYVLGNPPFVGSKYQSADQRADMDEVAGDLKNAGLLDYVTGWYFKTIDYIRTNPAIHVAFVSTNSITQGEQVGVLWPELFRRGAIIHFGHRTFSWTSEARNRAHVHVVIIGWGLSDRSPKRIYDYETDPDTPAITEVRQINPYLVQGPLSAVVNRLRPLCDVPEIGIGNKPIDGGNYLFTPEEKAAFLRDEPHAEPFFRRWLGSEEFINGIERWCLWLGDCPPNQLRRMPRSMERIENVRQLRRASRSEPTRRIADTPTRFHVENMPTDAFLVIPKVSSERRAYIPLGFISPPTIVSDLVFVMQGATLYHFGILHSAMHMAWVRQVCGRLESRYRYSARLVYNNFPWPQTPTDAQRQRVERAAQAVLDARAQFPGATLADLYDPVTMPPALRRAHDALDLAVDRAYRAQPFPDERRRFEYLFEQYERLTAPLTAQPQRGRGRSRRTRG